MPILAPKNRASNEGVKGGRMSAEDELMLISGWGRCHKRLERVLADYNPNVNHKADNGITALHNACICGSSAFVKRLIEENADPNVPATAKLQTPLDLVLMKIAFEEEQDEKLHGFDQINLSNGASIACRVDISEWRMCKKILEAAGAVQGGCLQSEPNIMPDGSINGGPPSELRAYTIAKDGSYSIAHQLRSGKYDVLKYENGMLVQAEYDGKTGHWDVGTGMTCEEVHPQKSSPH